MTDLQRTKIVASIGEIDAAAWNSLNAGGFPFLRHEFLLALEETRCVGRGTGWTPQYLTVHDSDGIAAAAPAWLKSHSYGEFVFDFSWAQAHARAGLNYYPKLTLAVPFTPATGPRLLVRPQLQTADAATLRSSLILAIEKYAAARELSSAHALFVDAAAREAFERAGWLARQDCQFHWTNRGYESFEQYLATFTHDKRKKVRRERRRVAEAGIVFETLAGGELDKKTLDAVFELHRDTFLRHGREPYLTRAFFTQIAKSMGDSWMVKLARHGSEIVATAIFFESPDALYGRYWGSSGEHHSLHFETCYHQGIEYAIDHKLARFEPGTQGEHKVARGFEPTMTASMHWIAEPRFRSAIGEYLEREGAAINEYAADVQDHVPFRDP